MVPLSLCPLSVLWEDTVLGRQSVVTHQRRYSTGLPNTSPLRPGMPGSFDKEG